MMILRKMFPCWGAGLYVDHEKLPLILVTDGRLNGIYAASGYNVGTGRYAAADSGGPGKQDRNEEKRTGQMDDNMQISGARALDFLKMFDFVREAGTCGEQAAAGKIRSYLEQNVSGPGITLREEPFSFEESRILEACLEVTEPYQKA